MKRELRYRADLGAAVSLGIRQVPRWKRGEYAAFCSILAQLLNAAVPLLEALSELGLAPARSATRYCAGTIIFYIRGGQSISKALGLLPLHFDAIAIGLIQAGESSGRLKQAFETLTQSVQWREKLWLDVRRAISYPLLIAIALLALVVFLIGWLLPRLADFLDGSDRELPWLTRRLLAAAGLTDMIVFTLFSLFSLGFMLLVYLPKRSARLRLLRDRWLLEVPAIGPFLKRLLWSRVAALIGQQYAAGVSVLAALWTAHQAVGNLVVARALLEIRQHVVAGNSLSISFARSRVFSSLMVRMVRMGERTGQLDTALQCVCDIHWGEAQALLSRYLLFIEPCLTLLLALLLAILVIAVLGPMYDTFALLP